MLVAEGEYPLFHWLFIWVSIKYLLPIHLYNYLIVQDEWLVNRHERSVLYTRDVFLLFYLLI